MQIQPLCLLKDKSRIFSKLFINSSYHPYLNQPSLIVSPMFISLILKQINQISISQTVNLNMIKQYRKSIIKEILQLFMNKKENSISVWAFDQEDQMGILDLIVMNMLKEVQTQQDITLFQYYLPALTYYYPVHYRNLIKLTQYLSKAFYDNKFYAIKFKFIITLLKNYYDINKKGLQDLSMPFFYLYGQSCLGIRNIQRHQKKDMTNNIKNVIIKCNNSIPNNTRKVKTLLPSEVKPIKRSDINKTISNLLKQCLQIPSSLIPNKTYRLILILSSSCTQIHLNNDMFSFQSIIKKDQKQFVSVSFGQGFQGMLTSLLLVNKRIQIEKAFTYKEFPNGLSTWDLIKKFKDRSPKIAEKVLFAYLPFSVFQLRCRNYCFDPFHKIHGEITENVIVFKDDPKNKNLSYIGGVQPLLPLFYLSRFYRSQQYPDLLNKLLQILQIILINENTIYNISSSQSISQKYLPEQNEFPSEQFCLILGNHLTQLNKFINQKTFVLILNIFSKLNENQKIYYLKNVIWNIKISKINDKNVIKSYYVFMIKLYQNNKSIILKSLSFSQILYWIVYNFQTPTKTNHITSCCLQHHINNSISSTNFDIKIASQTYRHSYDQHYQWLERILSIVLEYNLIENLQQVEDNIRTLLRMLRKSFNQCFYILIFRIIKKQIKFFSPVKKIANDYNHFITILISKCRFFTFLQYLAEQTICLDLITEIFYLSLCVYQHVKQDDRILIIQFIKKTMRKIADKVNVENPIIEGTRRIRKKSQELIQITQFKLINEQIRSTQNINIDKNKAFLQNIQSSFISQISQSILKISHLNFINYQKLYHLVQNFLFNQISDEQLSLQQTSQLKFKNNDAFLLLSQYLFGISKHLPSNKQFHFKIKLFNTILNKIQGTNNINNRVYLMKSKVFNQIILNQLIYLQRLNIKQSKFNKKSKDLNQKSKELNQKKYKQLNKKQKQLNKKQKQLQKFQQYQQCIQNILSTFFIAFVQSSPTQITFIEYYSTLQKILTNQQLFSQTSNQKSSSTISTKQSINIQFFVQVLKIFQFQFLKKINFQIIKYQDASQFLIQVLMLLANQLIRFQKIQKTNQEEICSISQGFNMKNKNQKHVTHRILQLIYNISIKLLQLTKFYFIQQLRYNTNSNKAILEGNHSQLRQQNISFNITNNLISSSSTLFPLIHSNILPHLNKSLNLRCLLFDQQLITIKQQQINFLFDVIIPKFTSHFWELYGDSLILKSKEQEQVQKQALLKHVTQQYINQQVRKKVFVTQVIFDITYKAVQRQLNQLQQSIEQQKEKFNQKQINQNQKQINQNQKQGQKPNQQQFRNHQYSQENQSLYQLNCNQHQVQQLNQSQKSQIHYQNINNKLHFLIEVYQIFSIVNISKKNKFQNKSFLRMLTYQISGFLLNRINQFHANQKIKSIFINSYKLLWTKIFQLISFSCTFIQDIKNLQSYQQLQSQFQKCHLIDNFFIHLLQYFVFDRKNNQICSFIKLKTYLLSPSDDQIQHIIFCQQFKQNISLNGQIQVIQKRFSLMHQKILQQKYSFAFRSKRISMQKISQKSSTPQIQQINKPQQQILKQDEQNKIIKRLTQIMLKQDTLQQDTKNFYLYNREMNLRKFHKLWQNMWKNMRIYNQPYGFWMAIRNVSGKFQYTQKQLNYKNFTYKLSKYTSQSGLRPILDVKVIEPWPIIKKKCEQKFTESYNYSGLCRIQQKNKYKIVSTTKQTIWSYMWKSQPLKQKHFKVILIQCNIKAYGIILINPNQQIQFWYQNTNQQDSHVTFQHFHLAFNKQLYKLWPIIFIKQISRRRYLMKYHAIEIDFMDGTSFLFYFYQQDQRYFLEQLANIRQQKLLLIPNKIKENKVPIFMTSWYQEELPQELVQKWRNHQITTLQYLIKLNKIASRGGLDLSQYAVVPWITQINEQKNPKLRDLTKTMGGLGSQQRKQIVIQKFSSKDPFNPVPAFFFGTHYSSPGVVFNFLIRLSPFTEYLKNLQGGKYDIPDRLFASLVHAWRSAYSEVSDVRELVPEFYYLPQCFINLEKLNFGQTQSFQQVHNVALPIWAADNPYFFVVQFRQILQSEQASENISDWIDLIFGYKQKGIQAEKNLNLYYYLTYEQYSDLQNEEDLVHKRSCQAQIVHFGQIPPQLFDKPHPKRLSLKNKILQLKQKQKYLLMNKLSQKAIGIELNESKKTLIIVKRGCIQHYSTQKNPLSLIKSYKINIQKSQNQWLYLFKKQSYILKFFPSHPYFLLSGYITNQLRLYSKSHGKLQRKFILPTKITSILLNEEESLVVIGMEDGMVAMYEIEYDNGKVKMQIVYQHRMEGRVEQIIERDGWILFVVNHYVHVYKIARSLHYLAKVDRSYEPTFQFIRSFRNNLKVLKAQLLTSPLYCLVIVDNASIKTYSINGQLIKSQHCNSKSSLKILKDNQLNEYISYLEDDRIIVMSTPDLRSICQLELRGDCLGFWKEGVMYQDRICTIGW